VRQSVGDDSKLVVVGSYLNAKFIQWWEAQNLKNSFKFFKVNSKNKTEIQPISQKIKIYLK